MSRGDQRLSIEQLQAFEAYRFGMFIHFGMSTFLGEECPDGTAPSMRYAPDRLDVGQWIGVAREAGMRYAVLTTKHVAGHALWPTRHSDYSVATSGNPTDVVAAFVEACRTHDVMPGFYYCLWDRHNRFGSVVPRDVPWGQGHTTDEYRQFVLQQIEELFCNYGGIGLAWIDIPYLVSPEFRRHLYDRIVAWQPQAVVTINAGLQDGKRLDADTIWPTDVLTLERTLPNGHHGYCPWHEVHGLQHYLPGEVCDPIGLEWFWTESDRPKADELLLGNYLVTVSRGCNLLLNVPPDRHGRLPEQWVGALRRLRQNLDRLEVS
jgi:alpha-L-fucosidase